MKPPREESQANANDLSARRSKRVNLAFPIVLSGTNSAGAEFQESTRTIIVSKHGAKIRTTQDLTPGALVTIENRSLRLSADAKVVSVGARRAPSEPCEIGVELTEAGNVWGVIFPPEDWEGESQSAVSEAEAAAVRERTTGTHPSPENTAQAPAVLPPSLTRTTPGTIAVPELAVLTAPSAPTTTTPAPPIPTVPVPASSREKIDAMTAAVLAKLSAQLDEAVDTRLKAYGEKVTRFTNQFALRVQANFQEAANRTEDQMVSMIQQKLGNLADRVQSSRTSLESLLARFEALQKNSKAWVEDTDQKIREASQVALESALQELAVSLQKGMENTTATLGAQCQEIVLDSVTRTVNATLAKADEQLALQARNSLFKANSELKWQQEQMMDGVKQQLNQIALAGTTDLSARLEKMSTDLIPWLNSEIEKSLQQSTAKLAADTTQSLQEQTRVLTQDTLVSLQQEVQGLQERLQEESRKVRQSSEQEISKMADAHSQTVARDSESALNQLQSASKQAVSELKLAEMESARSLKAGVEDYQKQLASRSGVALEGFQSGIQTLTRELQEGAAQLFSQKLQVIAEDLGESTSGDLRKRLLKEAEVATETSSKDFKHRLEVMEEEIFAGRSFDLQERMKKQAEAQIEATIQAAPAQFSDRLKKLTDESGVALVEATRNELQKLSSSLLQSASETLHRDFQQLSEGLQKDVKTLHASLTEEARRQLVTMSRSTVEGLNKEALGGLEEYRTRLHKVAQESKEERLRELQASFQEALDKQRTAMAALLQQQAEQSRDLAGLQIKTLSEQMVAGATENLERQVGKTTRTVGEQSEQARASLEIQAQKIALEAQSQIKDYQRQVEQSSNAALDKFRQDTGILLEEVVFRLQQSVRDFQNSTGNEVLTELQKASNNLLEVSAAQMRKQTEQTLEVITEKLKAKEEEVVSDAANVFRTRIADIFSILQEGSKKSVDVPNAERLKK